MTALLAALASTALAALLAFAAYAGTSVLAATVALIVVLVAIGWATLVELPDRRGTSIVVAITGWAGVGLALLARERSRPLGTFAVVIAFAVLAAFVHQLLRGGRREHLVESVTGTLAGEVVAVLGAGWVLLPTTTLGVHGVVVAAAALAVARLVGALPLPPRASGWSVVGAGAAASAVTVEVLGSPRLASLVAGLAVSVVVMALDRLVLAQRAARSPLGMLCGAAVPVAASGMAAYAVALLLAG